MQNKDVVCNKDNNVDDDSDDSVDNGDDDVFYCDKNGDKHLTHLLNAADYWLMKRSKQQKHVVCNNDDGAENGVDNVDDDSVEDGVDD
eukprot:13033643-Ditylum_brightwellii.AAC.1